MKFSKITISGKICTGKSTLLKNLQKKLNWPIFSTGQYFRHYSQTHQLNLEQAEEQNEQLTKKIDYMVATMLKQKKHLIVDGWMAGIMAKNLPDVLRILLICDDDIRYSRFAKREKISFDEAKMKVEKRQKSWFEKLKKIYQRDDFFEPKNYNFVIDTSNLTPVTTLKQVLQKLK